MEAIKLTPSKVTQVGPVFFHIIGHDAWREAKAAGRYAPDSLATEGFIHLSLKSQITRPANLLYAGRTDLALLVIDGDQLEENVVMEPGSHGEAEHFPHLYGQLPLEAVVDVVDFPPGPNGQFHLPEGLGG